MLTKLGKSSKAFLTTSSPFFAVSFEIAPKAFNASAPAKSTFAILVSCVQSNSAGQTIGFASSVSEECILEAATYIKVLIPMPELEARYDPASPKPFEPTIGNKIWPRYARVVALRFFRRF
jgi:hypothetical protein